MAMSGAGPTLASYIASHSSDYSKVTATPSARPTPNVSAAPTRKKTTCCAPDNGVRSPARPNISDQLVGVVAGQSVSMPQ